MNGCEEGGPAHLYASMRVLGALAMSRIGAVLGRESTTRKVRFARC